MTRPSYTAILSGMSNLSAFLLKAPIYAYRWSFKALFGMHCRHLPTCSEYSLEAIDRNGAWRGFWLMVSRLTRCRPGGTSGYDPVPDIRNERYIWTPWRYGRWTGQHMQAELSLHSRQHGKDHHH